jgi:single-strand DNA-binding protein
MNTWNGTGNLCADPELQTTSSGISVCKFTLAVKRPHVADETDFIRCVAWRKKAEVIGEHLRKGSKVGVWGYIKTGRYEKDGGWVYTTDIMVDDFEFLTPKGEHMSEPPKNKPQKEPEQMSDFEPLSDENMPF